ncbi:hypothetical protein Tco_0621916 [Tanacetum coccineum]
MEEMLAKFIDEVKRKHEEIEIFIKEFRTTNDLLLKKRSNLLSELKIEEKPHDVGVKNKSSSIPERTTQPLPKSKFDDDESWYADFVNYIVGKLKGAYFGAKTMIFKDCLLLFNTPYPAKKIRRISAWTSQENAYDQFPIRHFETNFPAIVYNDASTSNQNVSSEPTVSIYNAIKADIDFHISFSDFEDEDYTFIYNKDSSSYKLIPINDLKPEPVNDHVEINTELCSENIDIKPMDMVICTSNDTTSIELDENIETNHDTLGPCCKDINNMVYSENDVC